MKPGILMVGIVVLLVLCLLSCLAGGGVDLLLAFSEPPWNTAPASTDSLIFWQTRLPRVLAGCLAGASLALSGLTLQAVLRNPLAEPYILGLSAGAALGKGLFAVLLPAGLLYAPFAVHGVCFVSALLPLLGLQFAAARSRLYSPTALLLAGVMINTIISAILLVLQTFAPPETARQMQLWWLGGLDIVGYDFVIVTLIVTGATVFILLRKTPMMNLLSMNVAGAFHLGVNVTYETRLLLWLSTLLTSAIVALCGPIAFAGLLVPHILRRLFGADNRVLGPLCVVYGAIMMVGCDLLGWRGPALLQLSGVSTISSSVSVPVGIITSLVGGPVFLVLLFRQRNNEVLS